VIVTETQRVPSAEVGMDPLKLSSVGHTMSAPTAVRNKMTATQPAKMFVVRSETRMGAAST
jgi:hypothetical protein